VYVASGITPRIRYNVILRTNLDTQIPTSYRESGPRAVICNFLCVSAFIPKKHLSRTLRKMLLMCFFGIKTLTQSDFVGCGEWGVLNLT
jgi:hypothetical protein